MIFTVLSITVPFFLLIFLGICLRTSNFITKKNTKFLSKFAFYALMPPLIFSKISIPLLNSESIFYLRFEAVTVFLFLLAYPIGSILKQDTKGIGIIGLNMAYPNYGYIGVPLCLIAFGDKAALPLPLLLLRIHLYCCYDNNLYLFIRKSTKQLKPEANNEKPLWQSSAFSCCFWDFVFYI